MQRRHRFLAFLLAAALGSLAWAPAAAQVVAGHEFPRRAESPHPYPAGRGAGPVWTSEVEHPQATYIALHFERFDLAPGHRLVIRSDDGRQRHVLTGRGRHDLGTFWAPHVKGDRARVELFAPGRNPGAWGVAIDSYAAGVLDLGADADLVPGLDPADVAGSAEAICGADDRQNAICYTATEPEAYERSRAVARLLVNGQLWCTGWLVGCQGHLLTNNHCIDHPALSVGPADAVLNTDYEFLSEAPSCGSSNGPGSWPGTIWSGAPTLVQRDFFLDYALILLAGNPQDSYGSFQLENRPPVAEERIYIPQHPGGQARRIGLTSSDPADASGFCEILQPDSGQVCIGGAVGETTYLCDTQGDSSGSPVVAYTSQAVVALHHCAAGTGLCPNLGVPSTALIADLGLNLPSCAVADAVTDLTYHAHVVDDDPLGNRNGVPEPVEIVHLQVDLRNDGNFLATGVSAVLGTTTPGITVLDDSAEWPQIPGFGSRTSLSPHFVVEVDESVPCGTVMDFDLAISSDQGSYGAVFQQTVGASPGGSGSYPSVDTPLAIPDNSPPGAISTVTVNDTFPLGEISVSVDIRHTRISNLEVDLISPTGTVVRLHNGTGGAADDIVTTYDTLTLADGPGSMTDFLGENSNGNWQLRVVDTKGNDTGTIDSWTLDAAESGTIQCDPVPCQVSAAAQAVPAVVCPGESLLLGDAGSSEFGEDCSGTLEFQFKHFSSVLQDWSTDPDVAVMPGSTTTYTVHVRDAATLAQDTALVDVTLADPAAVTAVQQPDPLCVELPSGQLDGGAGFASYTWRDDGGQVVGTSRTLPVDGAACGRTYDLEVQSLSGCNGSTQIAVSCAPCTPPEVSPAGSPVPLRMDLDGLGSMEFELLPDPAVYHLYQAADVDSFLAGDWTTKFCDLAAGTTGTWSPVEAGRVRWTPVIPDVIAEGYWVVVAERGGLESLYGVMSGGPPRPADADRAGSDGNFGCP